VYELKKIKKNYNFGLIFHNIINFGSYIFCLEILVI